MVEKLSENKSRSLIEEHFNFCKIISKRYCNSIGLDVTKDISAEGFVGLVRAANSHNPDKSPFKSWAAFKIRCEISNYIKSQFGTKKGKSKREAVQFDIEENNFRLEDTSSNTEKRVINKDRVSKLLQCISEKWKKVIRMHYVGGYSLAEIGILNGYTRSNASRIKRAALAKMLKQQRRNKEGLQ